MFLLPYTWVVQRYSCEDVYKSSEDSEVDSEVKSSDIMSHSYFSVTKLGSDDTVSAGLKNKDLNFKDLEFILLRSHFSAHCQKVSNCLSILMKN